MPTININGANLYYEVHGEGPETILFSHGLLWSGKMFEKQVEFFKNKYRCVTYDHRGQGQSEVTDTGYDMENMAKDAIALIEELELEPCHMVGLSMGGFVTMRVAARRPDLLKSVILLETSADPEPNTFKYALLNTIVKLFGVSIVQGQVMPIMFGQTFLKDPNRKEELDQWRKELLKNQKTIVKAVQGVIDRDGVYEEITQIDLPTLIMVGDEDVATIPAKAERIHGQIKESKLVTIAGAGHSSSIEQPEQVNQAISEFLNSVEF